MFLLMIRRVRAWAGLRATVNVGLGLGAVDLVGLAAELNAVPASLPIQMPSFEWGIVCPNFRWN
jgi:hypothetical protein